MMKKLLILFFTLAFTSVTYAEKVTEQQALQKAQQFFKDKGIVSANPRRAKKVEQQSDATQEDFYVFNAENNGGFVIISGDDRTEEILGYADSGSLDMDNLPPNLKGWLEGYSKQIDVIRQNNYSEKTTTRRSPSAPKVAIEPLVTTKWGQGNPYNGQCPVVDGKHCVTGCVATAMAQVMYYHKWPQQSCEEIPAYTTATKQIQMNALPPTTFKWDAMKSKYWEGEQGESADAVAELMRYCGQAVEMNYTIDESGAFEMPRHLIQYFGYSKNAKYITMSQYTITQWEDILYKELSEGRPMLYGGANLNSAHEFICDGYDGDGYFHFNWGWNGEANGFYQLSILYRTIWAGYVYGQTAIIGLEPEKGEIAIPYVYGYNGGGVTQTNYSRPSTSDNFTNIILNGGIYIQYEVDVPQDVTLDYGLGLYQGDQLLSVLKQSTATLNLDNKTVANEMSLSFGSNLADGSYQIRHIYKYPNSEAWITCYDSFLNYIVATISGTTMTLQNAVSPDVQEADYIVNDVSFSPGIHNNNITMVTVNLTNTGNTNQELLNFWAKTSGCPQGYDLICGFIPPGETGNVVFPTDLNEKGEVTLCISSKINYENVRWEKVVTMPEEPECMLTCTDYSIKKFENGILKDSKLQITLTIKNTGDKIFNGVISYILGEDIDDTKIFTEVVRQLQSLTLNAGESTTFDAIIPHLDNNERYQLSLYCNNSVIYFPDCFSLEFFVATHNYTYEGLNYVYEPGAMTASVIAGDYQQLDAVTIPSTISVDGQSYKVTEIAPKVFNGCNFQSVTLPEGLERIRSYAFQLCRIETINFPSSLKHISDYAFYCSSGIKEIALPEGLVSIGPAAFSDCRDLEVLKLPSTLGSIGGNAISNCNNLKSVYSAMADPIPVPDNAFLYFDFSGDIPKQVPCPATLIVPTGCKAAYEAADNWKDFKEIMEIQEGNIVFADAKVKAICVANWDANGDGELNEEEAAAVTSIGTVFKDNEEITSFDELSYFTGLTSIEGSAFFGCSSMTSIKIPNSVTTIGVAAFLFCTNLTSVTIPSNVKIINKGTFAACTNLTSVTIPDGVTSIGDNAFDNCSSLTSITIPSSVTTIGMQAFAYSGLTSLTIPSSVTTIGGGAFSYSGLTSVTIPSSVTSISVGAFEFCTSLTSVTIPSSVTTIGDNSFYGCTGLQYVSVPSSVTSIENRAFYNCKGLTSIEIPNSVTSISEYAFCGCSGLTSIEIPNSVTSISEYTFYGCEGLTSVIIPNSVTTIGSSAFYGCASLTSVTIPNSVTSIGEWAFQNCTSLASVTIGNSVTAIGFATFYGCSGLTSIVVEGGNSTYDSRENCNAIIETSTNKLIVGCKNSTILSSVTTIGGGAFSDCSGLTSITIPNSVTSIDNGAFIGCTGLTSVIIGNGIKTIISYSFSNCTKLADVYCYAENVPTTGTEAFDTSPIDNATLHVPSGAIDAYKAADPWKNFKNIIALTDGDPKPTGIDKIVISDNNKGVFYDLNGRRIANPSKGIYIKNGKKYVVK